MCCRSYARTRAYLHRFVEHGLVTAQDAGSAVLYALNGSTCSPAPSWAVNSAAAVESALGEQLVTAVREDQPLIAGLRQDGRVLVGPPLRELLAVGARA